VNLSGEGRHRILLVSLALWAACFLYLTLAPDLPRIGSVDTNDYSGWGHIVGTMGLAVILYLLALDSGRFSTPARVLGPIVAASAFGVAVELLQALTGTRDPSVGDALFDVVGAIVAVGLVSLVPGRTRALTIVTAVVTAVFAATTVVAAAFFTPEPVGEHDCSVTDVASRAPRQALPSGPGSRTSRGLVALYVPGDGTGATVPNRQGPASTALHLVEPGVERVPDGLRFSGGAARTNGPATPIIDALVGHGALTIEAWVRSSDLQQNGPTRIVTMSDGTARDDVDVHLGQERDGLSVRLRASCGQFNSTIVDGVFERRDHDEHIVLTFAGGMQRVYVQGRLVASARFDGRIDGWNRRYPLVVGNETTEDRSFLGDVALVAVYDRALRPSEVAASAAAGPPGSP
jgi:VanZ family protein